VSHAFDSVRVKSTAEDLHTTKSVFLCRKLADCTLVYLLIYADVMRDGSQF